jgi:hypothetical protein
MVGGEAEEAPFLRQQASISLEPGARPRSPLQANHSTDAQRATIFLAASR